MCMYMSCNMYMSMYMCMYMYVPVAQMQGWLPMLERKLEIAQEIAHEDFRCFVTAEPPGMPSQMLIPEGSTLSLARIEHRMRVGWEVDWVGGLGVGLERGGRHEPALPCRCCLP